MSMFTWRTEMRATKYSATTDEEARRRESARAVDRLQGQAAMQILDGDRVELVTMPDTGTFSHSVIISADDMRALARVATEQLGPAASTIEFPATLLGLIDEIVKLARELPEDASDDMSRYGDALQRYEAMRADLDRRYRIAERQANNAVGTERGGGMQHALDLLNGYA